MLCKTGKGAKIDTLISRFSAKISMVSADGCWLWMGCKSRGYGQIQVGHKMVLAHRVALYLRGIEIPTDCVVDHKCGNTLCVNPSHLRVVLPRDNQKNKRINSRNKCGFKGVSRLPNGRFKAVIASDGIDYYIGSFDTPEAASRAYVAKAKELHGEYANSGAHSIGGCR